MTAGSAGDEQIESKVKAWLDPKTMPSLRGTRGQRRALQLPALIPVIAVALFFGGFFFDSCEDAEGASDAVEHQVRSSRAVAERVMKGYEAGEVPAALAEPVEGERAGSAPILENLASTERVMPTEAGNMHGPQGSAGVRAVPRGLEGPFDRRGRRASSREMGGGWTTDQASVLEQQRAEDLRKALQGPSRVEIASNSGSQTETLSGPAAQLAKLNERLENRGSGQSYMEMLAALKQAGMLGEAQGGSSVRQRTGGYGRFDGELGTDRWFLGSSVQQTKMFSVLAGSVIPATLETAINSDLPGPIKALVAQDVRDTVTGRYILIPQGARLLGTYGADVKLGQERLLVAWQRIVFPNGQVLDIGAMPGTDGAGQAGLSDEVHTHFWRMFRSALLMSAVTGGVGLSQGQGTGNRQTMGDTMSQALGQQFGQLTEELIRRDMNVAPTLVIRPGYRLNVSVTKDLVLERPYLQATGGAW